MSIGREKSRELIIENFRSSPLQILFAPRGSGEDKRAHYTTPPLLASAHNRAEEVARVTRKTFKPESFQSASCCCPPFSPPLVRLLLNISSNVKFNRWLVIMKTNSRETDRLPANFCAKDARKLSHVPLPYRKSHESPSNFCNKASPVSRESFLIRLCHSLSRIIGSFEHRKCWKVDDSDAYVGRYVI